MEEPRDPTEDIWPDPDETADADMDDYVEPWRRGVPPPFNAHLTQLQPRRDQRNPLLDEQIAAAREAAKKRRVSGHSLIRTFD